MATYNFECLACKHREIYSMSMKDASARMTLPCTECEDDTLHKQIVFARPVHFKGTGWPDKEKRA